MAQIRTGAQVLTRPGYALIEPDSRVITLLCEWASGGDYFEISEAIANSFHILSVSINVIWIFEDAAPMVDFRVTVGTGKEVDWATVSEWPAILPVRYEHGRYASWLATPELCQITWPMNLGFTEQGRRLGISCRQFDDSRVQFYTSFQIAEG